MTLLGHGQGMAQTLFNFFLGVRAVAAAILPVAVDYMGVRGCVALSVIDHLVAVLLGKLTKGTVHDVIMQAQCQTQGGFFLDVIAGQGVVILQLLASLVLNFHWALL